MAAIAVIAAGWLGALDLLVSATRPGSWERSVLTATWPWLQPAIMIALVFVILSEEHRRNQTLFASTERLAGVNQRVRDLEGQVALLVESVKALEGRADELKQTVKEIDGRTLDVVHGEPFGMIMKGLNENLANLSAGIPSLIADGTSSVDLRCQELERALPAISTEISLLAEEVQKLRSHLGIGQET
jgi:prefoldin subunit 5